MTGILYPALRLIGVHAHFLAKLSEVTVHLFLVLEKFLDAFGGKVIGHLFHAHVTLDEHTKYRGLP
jgi:hypothetical protein